MPGQGFSFTRDHSSCTRDAERSMRQQIADLRRQDLRCLKIERHKTRCHVTPLATSRLRHQLRPARVRLDAGVVLLASTQVLISPISSPTGNRLMSSSEKPFAFSVS